MKDVKPTRAEELRLKKQIKLAESGHSILEKKRDSLIHSFMERVQDAQNIQSQQAEQFKHARQKVQEAAAKEGFATLRSAALATPPVEHVELKTANVMGVDVPDITAELSTRTLTERGYNPLASTAWIDEAASAFEELLDQVVAYAEIETGLIKLLDEIEKTKRRVNALEEKVIPEQKAALNYVSQVLEESEREETFRMKKIKQKTARQ